MRPLSPKPSRGYAARILYSETIHDEVRRWLYGQSGIDIDLQEILVKFIGIF